MSQNPLTLTRQTLYELVWSRPLSNLAQEFGISDVGLAKRCRAVDVPIPYRGYWARKAAGQDPPKLPLPKYRTKAPPPTAPAGPPKPVKGLLRHGPEPSVHFDRPIEPASRESTPRDSPLPFTAAERTGFIIDLQVSKHTLSRALLLADRFIQTAEAIGWPLTDPPPPQPPDAYPESSEPPAPDPTPKPPFARLLVDAEPISFLIEERYREEARAPTAHELARERREYLYHAPRTTSIPTGALRLVRIDTVNSWSPRRKSWYDQGGNRVEQRIQKILAAFFERAQEIKAARADEERRQREWAEQERLRKEKKARRDAHTMLRADLERQAGAWHRARFLRRYVRAARRSLGLQLIERPFVDQTIDFLEWAENYIDQVDPLSAVPRNQDQWPEPRDYICADEAGLKVLLLRITGFDGRTAKKLNDIEPGPHGESSADDDDA